MISHVDKKKFNETVRGLDQQASNDVSEAHATLHPMQADRIERGRWRVVLLCVLSFIGTELVHRPVAPHDYSDPNFLANKIYREFVGDAPCVLLLKKDGEVGCSFKDNGLSFPLLRLRNEQEIRDFMLHTTEEKRAIMIDRTYFTSTYIPLTENQKMSHIGAILIRNNNASAPTAFSPAAQYPWQEFSLHSTADYKWNPFGNSWALHSFPHFPIVLLRDDDADFLVSKLAEHPAQTSFPKWSVEFNYQMWATRDTSLCLDRHFCLPLGSESVWSSFGALDPSKQLVLGIAGLDASGMFHDRVIGANTAVSGTAAMLAAAHAISRVDPAIISSLDKQLVFAFFQGEAFGYIGSRAFVHDMTEGSCEGSSCSAFQQMKLTNIAAILEAKQVGSPGAPSSLYVHTERPANRDTSNLIKTLMLNAGAAGVNLQNASASTPGIPPSSLNSFLLANAGLGGAVITDHDATYTNQYYDSDWDGKDNVDAARVCKAATLIARSMLDLATSTQEHPEVQANCSIVAALLDCLISNASCELFSGRVLPANMRVGEFSHYVGVFQGQDAVPVSSKAAFELLFDWTLQVPSLCSPKQPCPAGQACYKGNCTSTFYHNAISPAFAYDSTTDKYRIVDPSHPTFAESYWARLNMRVYQKEAPALEVVIFVFGLVETLVAAALLMWLRPKLGFDIVLQPPRPPPRSRQAPQSQGDNHQHGAAQQRPAAASPPHDDAS